MREIWLRRLAKKQGIWLYRDDSALACYALDLQKRFRSVGKFVERLIRLDCAWYWTSALPSRDPRHPVILRGRPFSALTNATVAQLVEDFEERDEDGYGRFIALLALDKEVAEHFDASAHLSVTLRNFVARGDPPLRVVIMQLGDWKEQVFVPERHWGLASDALTSLGITPDEITSTTKYKNLRLARLEKSIEGILECATSSGKPRLGRYGPIDPT